MKTLILFLLAASVWGANYNCTSTGTGDFNAAGTWASCNSTYPDNSTDTFTFSIGATHVVTIPAGADITIGQSLAANTAQGTMANTGKLVLAADTSGVSPTILRMKGDLAITTVGATCTLDGATNCNGVEMNPGTVLIVDSDGSGTSYAIGQTANGNSRWFKADCTDATSMPPWDDTTSYNIGYRVSYQGVNYISIQDSHTNQRPDLFGSAYWKKGNCAILSVGATNAVFSLRGFSFGGGNRYFRHVALNNFGTSSVDAIACRPHATNNPVGGCDIMYSSISNSGTVDLDDGDRTATSVHRLTGNIFTNCLNTSKYCATLGTSTTAMTSGIREIKENVFVDGSVGASGSSLCYGCTVEGNYAAPSATSDSYTWGGSSGGASIASFKGNFYLNYHSGNPITSMYTLADYNYVVNGPARTNLRCMDLDKARIGGLNAALQYNVCANLGSDVAGDAFLTTQTAGGLTMTFTGNATELNRDGTSCCNLITWLGTSSPGGTDTQVMQRNIHIGSDLALLDVETSYHCAGCLEFLNNTIARVSGTMAKVLDVNSCALNPNDVCAAGDCNYNIGVNLSYTPPGGCTNAHNGYILDLSAGTGWGANDRNLTTVAEAQFVDHTRTFATAATDWLGQTATAGAWSNASVSYAVGDIVSDSQAGVWQGKTVLYRALAAHTSADTSRPANGATWQTACGGGPCWEYASAYFLRTMIAKGQRITDASIGANNDYVPKAMVLWRLHGLRSGRLDLACSGSDGESPWPIPSCAKLKGRIGAMAF